MRCASSGPAALPTDRQSPYTVLAYTPLYYWLAAGLQAFIGPGFGPGRVLSMVAGVAAAAILGGIAARRAGQAWVGVFASLLFLAFAFPGGVPWLGVYRVDMLGVALALAAIAVLTCASGTRGLVAAGVIAAWHILCKQTQFAALISPAHCGNGPTGAAAVFSPARRSPHWVSRAWCWS